MWAPTRWMYLFAKDRILFKIEFYSEPFTFYGAFKIQGSKKKKHKVLSNLYILIT